MKRVVIIVITLIFSVSFCMAQNDNLKNIIENENNRKAAEQQKIQAQKRQQDAAYNGAIASAERNFEQERYELAKQDYRKAIEIKPENKSLINKKIAEIDKLIADAIKAEQERKYQEAIKSAQRNIEQERYELAGEDYLTALGIKPENADFINEQIGKIGSMIALEKKKREAAERERLYNEAIASAERNIKQGQYEHAKDDYRDAIGLKPENAAFVNQKIAELDRPATLYIYRKGGFLATSHRYNIFLDNKVICQSENRLKKVVTITTFGTKTISATIENRKAEVQINFRPSGIYYVRSSVKSDQRNTGKYKTVTEPVYKTTGSILKGTYKREQIGTQTKQEPIKETYYTPILEEVSKSLGEAEYHEIKDK